ncbi:MAG: enoyl-CoA hydratase/isomerase family protein [Anaerolineales bacterium]|nr:enoyl-CoA hydratase/isomerase family protein [Anaerolineales bacterium]
MNYRVENAVVVGSGTMGAAIAAHLANAGIRVTLLDIVPRELTEQEAAQGLTLEDKVVRNRIVESGLQAALKSRPASFFSPEVAKMVTVGNLEDDLDVIKQADWVIEAIIENLKIKRQLFTRIEEVRPEHTIISTNTSGIPIHSICEGMSEGFRQHFLGTHFFNPPRYLKLLELIPGPDTLPEVIDFIAKLCEVRLGKGVVMCKDTPNFIGNRVFSVAGGFALKYVLENDYTISEVDAITGPVMGRPKTATFRLLDLVGLDVAHFVGENLAPLIEHDQVAQEVLKAEKPAALSKAMLEKKWLGNKTKVGYYKVVMVDGNREFWTLNLKTLEHEPPGDKVRFDSIGKVRGIEKPGARIKALLEEDDKAADLARALTYQMLAYCSQVIPEIADLPSSIDDALRWGFMHEIGPFEIWDALGVAAAVEKMRAEGFDPAAWVDEMIASGFETFYQYQGELKVGIYNPAVKQYQSFEKPPGIISLPALRMNEKVVSKNDSASLVDLGEGIVCVEFHSKMNTFDTDIGEMINKAMDLAEDQFEGIVIGNQGAHFSAGANLFLIVMYAQQGQWDELSAVIKGLQDMNMRMRYSLVPVVLAPFGYTLGGGAEVMMHASRIVASGFLVTGLVEVGMGLLPAGGGTKEMVRRVVNPVMRTENADPMPFIQQLFMQIGTAKVATSPVEAREFGMLSAYDRIVMNDDYLLMEAKREARHMADSGYVPPYKELIYAAGRDVLSSLTVGVWMFEKGKYISEYDGVVGQHVAEVLTGGNISQPQWVEEQYFLDLEREKFLSLCGQEKTRERIWHFLNTGKPLRN